MNKDDLIQHAVAAVQTTTGIKLSIEGAKGFGGNPASKGYQADALLGLAIPDRTLRLIASCKSAEPATAHYD